MTATGTAISLDEYLSTVYDPDREYVDGELIERNMGESDHSAIQTMISASLYSQRRELGIHVFAELRVQVVATRYRIPDITVTKQKVRGPRQPNGSEKRAWSYTGEGKRESSVVLTTSDPRLTLALDDVFSAVDDDIEA
jgi:Uma2 family endonuclease